MGADTPTEVGEPKPVVKSEGRSNNQHSGRNNANRRDNYIKKEKFLGADHDLRGYVFGDKRNRSEQVTNFTTVNEIIKAHTHTHTHTHTHSYSHKAPRNTHTARTRART